MHPIMLFPEMVSTCATEEPKQVIATPPYEPHVRDVAEALQHNRALCRDPRVGRWLNQEPLGFEAGAGDLFRYPEEGRGIRG